MENCHSRLASHPLLPFRSVGSVSCLGNTICFGQCGGSLRRYLPLTQIWTLGKVVLPPLPNPLSHVPHIQRT